MRRLCRQIVAALLALAALAPAVLAAADPFYLRLEQEGLRALARGDHETAARRLRIACFGMLDEPELLTQCLVRLGLAQAAAGDQDGLRATFRRVVEIEERLGAYSAAPIPEAERSGFERQLVVRLPAEELRSSPLYAAVADDLETAELARLPPQKRRRELERRAAAAPADPRWPLELARLEAEQGRERRALPWLDEVLRLDPANGEARCLRAVTSAALDDCATALAEHGACTPTRLGPRAAGRLLGCLADQQAWDGARTLLDGLPAAVRAAPTIARTAARIEKERPAAVGSEPASAGAAAAAIGPGPESVEAAPPTGGREAVAAGGDARSPATLSGEDLATMAAVRETLDRATRIADLAAAIERATELAERHSELVAPQLLAAEAAYLASRWEVAARYFERAGELGTARPELLFYKAVALFETGERERAASVLSRALEHVERTAYVEAWAERILGARP